MNFDVRTWPQSRRDLLRVRYQRDQILQHLGPRAQGDNGEIVLRQVLLRRQSGVECDENVETLSAARSSSPLLFPFQPGYATVWTSKLELK